ncbi:response regulator [Mucilaginibacter pallidiroseus]|uniref:Response regulator n=1 Tax=Mucilaginibacter pallidiroseus TaxID=2599295 RepID=A0A563UHT9_9SPHI|nr:response regulator [Mucilaginibacter pallidiroseus]TWR30952.1 response regulator [Mucilaginibacter pallidiroseus]
MSAKIIICDDEQEILDITSMILEAEGYTVIPTINSLTVTELVASEKPDIVLLDLWMPGLSGDQVARQLRSDEAVKSIPIIVISASRDGREIAFAAGANDFLEKPYDIDALLSIVNRHLLGGEQIAS